MSQVRINFLNWRPDLEAFGNDGLTVANNVIHDEEGYKQVTLGTSTSQSTLTGIDGRTLLSVEHFLIKPMGPGRTVGSDNFMVCYIEEATAAATGLLTLHEAGGVPNVGGTGPITTFGEGTAVALRAFDTCALGDYVFGVAEYVSHRTGGAITAGGVCAYGDIS